MGRAEGPGCVCRQLRSGCSASWASPSVSVPPPPGMCSPKASRTSTPSSPPSASGRARGKKTGTSGRSSTSTASRRCAAGPSGGSPGPPSWAWMYGGHGVGGVSQLREAPRPPGGRLLAGLRWGEDLLTTGSAGRWPRCVRSLSEARGGGGEGGPGSDLCLGVAWRPGLSIAAAARGAGARGGNTARCPAEAQGPASRPRARPASSVSALLFAEPGTV